MNEPLDLGAREPYLGPIEELTWSEVSDLLEGFEKFLEGDFEDEHAFRDTSSIINSRVHVDNEIMLEEEAEDGVSSTL